MEKWKNTGKYAKINKKCMGDFNHPRFEKITKKSGWGKNR